MSAHCIPILRGFSIVFRLAVAVSVVELDRSLLRHHLFDGARQLEQIISLPARADDLQPDR
jgi:hypothetical protein